MNIDNILSQFNIFLTGGSGFVGCVILQQLLSISTSNINDDNNDDNDDNNTNTKSTKQKTSSKDIGNIYLLLRASKKFGSIQQRLRNEILKQSIFELSDEEIETILVTEQRIIPIEGDLTSDMLNIHEKDLNGMKHAAKEKPMLVIHCAADVDFNREINMSLDINVNGTFQCIRVAKEVHAKGFVHISTLYANSREQSTLRVMERIYDAGFDAVSIFDNWLNKYNKHFDAQQVNQFIKSKVPLDQPNCKKDWPNHYTLTKNIAEKVAVSYCNKWQLPISIARLGIVSPVRSLRHRGWFMGSGGFVFIAIGEATGNIKYLCGDGEGRPDFIPVDYTVNALLAIAARLGNEYLLASSQPAQKHAQLREREPEPEQKEEDNTAVVTTTTTTTATANAVESDVAFDASKNGRIYQIGVVAVDESWNIHKLTEYLVPRWRLRGLPDSPPDAGAKFISSAVLFFFIELVLYEIPLFFVSILYWVLSVFTKALWCKLYYNFFGLETYEDLYTLRNYAKTGKQQQTYDLATQIRSIEMQLVSSSTAYLRKLQFMLNARAKLKWFHANYSFFVNQKWVFDHTNVKELYSCLDETSQLKYDFDIDTFNFHEYCLDVAVKCYLRWLEYKKTRRLQYKEHTIVLKEKLLALQNNPDADAYKQFRSKERVFTSVLVFLMGIGRRLLLAIAITAVLCVCVYYA